MIISEIKVLTSSVQNIFGTITGVITLSSNSRSDKAIVSTKWTTDILVGTAGNLYPDTGGTFIPLIENQDLTLFFSWIDIEKIAVTLTVTDEEGKVSTCSVWIANDPIYPLLDYWLFYGIKINEVILPSGLVEFTPSPFVIDLETNTDISTASTLDVFTFDKYNNTIDVTNSSINPTTFQGIYTEQFLFNTAKLVNTSFTGGYPIDLQSYVIPMFNPTILNAKDLILTNVDNKCLTVSAYSQTKSYIDKLAGRTDNSTMTELRVELITNCCEKLTYSLAPHYNITLTSSNCVNTNTPVLIGGFTYDVYDITITINGINPLIIASNSSTLVAPLNVFVVQYRIPTNGGPNIDATYTSTIINTAGHTYIFNITVSGNALLNCDERLTYTITYPEIPCGIEVLETTDNTQLIFNSTGYGETVCEDEGSLLDGIYQVNLLYNNLNNERISNCIFIDCETHCLVVKALALECNPLIQVLYDGLTYMDSCDILTCQQKCDLYETLINYLKECDCTMFENNVIRTKGCGCNK